MLNQFQDRTAAGQLLAARLLAYAHRADVLVLALPRGGVPVAFEIAKSLLVPLDVLVVRKLGVPGEEELAMGAIASGGVLVLNERVVKSLGISQEDINRAAAFERKLLQQRERLYRGDRVPYEVKDRTVILVDDGIATGATMQAAVSALHQQHCAHIVIATPVAAAQTCDELETIVDEVVCLLKPELFFAVSYWYEHFEPTSDEEVHRLLEEAARIVPAQNNPPA
ncbi:MAG TPA: phosphoribosyltransferase family protein [Ktedonobacteraceae bacterium]|nr:phosphoribosyltransferase family protein [Ktedonobacteraceae bacterium]